MLRINLIKKQPKKDKPDQNEMDQGDMEQYENDQAGNITIKRIVKTKYQSDQEVYDHQDDTEQEKSTLRYLVLYVPLIITNIMEDELPYTMQANPNPIIPIFHSLPKSKQTNILVHFSLMIGHE